MRLLLALLLFPAVLQAACGTNRLQYYERLLARHQTREAFELVLRDLNASPEERTLITLENGPETATEYSISINDIQHGKSAACQRGAYILSHIREKQRLQGILHHYHSEWEASANGWAGCSTEGVKLNDPATAASLAATCLEESGLGTRVSAREMRAYLDQVPAGDSKRLSDENMENLLQQMRFFHEERPLLQDEHTHSFYLPSIKEDDEQVFCNAVRYVRQTIGMRNAETAKWQKACLQK